ncbi:MAG: hypothetical protein IJV37_04475 [Bacteroidales bacterium]|nr:hypothetical protein [Bacteroidales bacterium]
MKPLLILSLVVPLLSCSPFGVKGSGRNDKPRGAVRSYEYRHSGTMKYPLEFICVERSGSGTLQLLYSGGGAEITVYSLSEEALERIGDLAAEYKLHKLKESYRPRMQILDGYMWHCHIRYEKGGISSGGSNARPPRALKEGIDAINAYLREQIREESIIGHAEHDSRNMRR